MLIKNLHVVHGAFKRVTLALHMCEMTDKNHLSNRKTVFSHKTWHDELLHAAIAPQKCRSAFQTLDSVRDLMLPVGLMRLPLTPDASL